MKTAPRKRAERRVSPFSNLEDTDWGREQERRHKDNLAQFAEGNLRFDEITLKLDDNTKITGEIKSSLGLLVEETMPYVKLRRAVRAGGDGATRLGKFGERFATGLLRLGKAGAAGLALWIAVQAVLHGANPVDAFKLLWGALFK